MSDVKDYQIEYVEEIFLENRIEAPSKEIIRDIISAIQEDASCIQEMDMYKSGWTVGEKCPKEQRIKELEDVIEKEKRKTSCKNCMGTGRGVTYGGTLRFESECIKCKGEGRI